MKALAFILALKNAKFLIATRITSTTLTPWAWAVLIVAKVMALPEGSRFWFTLFFVKYL